VPTFAFGLELQPLRRVRERRVGAELDHRLADVVVDVADVDVPRAGAVPRAGERLRERRVIDVRQQEERLTALQVGAHADREVGGGGGREGGVRLQGGVYRCQTSSRRIGTAVPSAVMPSTSTSGPPIMKSVWTSETLMPRSRISSGPSPSIPSIPNGTAAP